MQELLTTSILGGVPHSESLKECTVRPMKDTSMRIHTKRNMTGNLVQLRAKFATMIMDSILNIAM
jgi:hypothetical protein